MRFVISLLLAFPAFAASNELRVDGLIETVRAAVHQHTADKSFAKSLSKVTLSQRLELRTIEELESQGAGPETVAVLYDLREISASRPAANAEPLFPPPPAPTVEEQKAAFRQISSNALH